MSCIQGPKPAGLQTACALWQSFTALALCTCGHSSMHDLLGGAIHDHITYGINTGPACSWCLVPLLLTDKSALAGLLAGLFLFF